MFDNITKVFSGAIEREGPFGLGQQVEQVEVSATGFKFCSRYFIVEPDQHCFVHRDPMKMVLSGVTEQENDENEID